MLKEINFNFIANVEELSPLEFVYYGNKFRGQGLNHLISVDKKKMIIATDVEINSLQALMISEKCTRFEPEEQEKVGNMWITYVEPEIVVELN
jgi:hypothetical protein